MRFSVLVGDVPNCLLVGSERGSTTVEVKTTGKMATRSEQVLKGVDVTGTSGLWGAPGETEEWTRDGGGVTSETERRGSNRLPRRTPEGTGRPHTSVSPCAFLLRGSGLGLRRAPTT